MFDILKISKELEFSETDTIDLVNIITDLLPTINTTEKLIKYWIDNCFRADTTDEILEQFDEVEDIKEIGSRIFVLGSNKLVVIGYGKVLEDDFVIIEWCDNCGQETEISSNGGHCKHCGKFLLPCSLCNMDIVNCNKCKFKGGNI